MGSFEALDNSELVAVDGGRMKSAGQLGAYLGGSAAISCGTTLVLCGVFTGNIPMVGAGVSLVSEGVLVMRQYC